jgi:hypothetical protein
LKVRVSKFLFVNFRAKLFFFLFEIVLLGFESCEFLDAEASQRVNEVVDYLGEVVFELNQLEL